MASITVNGSHQYVSFVNYSNIANIGTSSFNTSALKANGGEGQMDIIINPLLFGYGVINSVSISYTAYGTRTGILGSKAQIKTGYQSFSTGAYIEVKSHGDVGRGSGNATSYTDPITPESNSISGCRLFFKCINPIATQTNEVYVSNISITINYTPASFTVSTKVSPSGAGTVKGGGSYSHGSTATLTATPNSGYKFVKWDDNNTSNPRNVTVMATATYTAIFEIDKIENILIDMSKPLKVLIDTDVVKGILVDTTKVYG